ncbi:MAG: tRNA pseudouridine(38-40) synthase TruA [Chloroflexi bacterium RBG_16_52_11]|nr:MAG: tRNA pseudouridine(38-40) synthase TruA [Chloroflexi bacterium RBG_16_52_11]
MARYQVILAYDGTHYHGFQRQANKATVQAAVEAGLRHLGWRGRSILAAGRTDAGVHAFGQVIAFDLDWNSSPSELQAALNAHLPSDVVARSAHIVENGFHPRYNATGRQYRYQLFCRSERDPLRERYAWRVWPPVDFEVLKSVSQSILGKHDFAAFGTAPRASSNTVRVVTRADWYLEGSFTGVESLVFEIVGDAFLYRMVRRLVYLQVACAQGKTDETLIPGLLDQPPPHPVQGLAPPQGLILLRVYFPEETPGQPTL